MSEIAPDFDQEEEGAGSPDMDAARTMLFPDAPDDEEEQLDEEQLDEEGAADDGGSSDDGAGGDEPAAPSSLAELAELAGLDVADLYDIPIAVNGAQEPTTLRALTELATQDTAAIERERESLDQQRTDFENQILQERATLQRVMAMLGPQNLTAEVIAQAQGMHQAYMDGERMALLEVKPEWSDDATFAAAKAEIAEFAATYGFTAADVESVYDHRLLKLMHDVARTDARIRKAKEQMVTAQKGRAGKRVSGRGREGTPSKAQTKTNTDTHRRPSAQQRVDEGRAVLFPDGGNK